MPRIVIPKSDIAFESTVLYLCDKYLPKARDQYPVMKAWSIEKHIGAVLSMLNTVEEAYLIIDSDDSGEVLRYAVVGKEQDIHVGDCYSVLCNYNRFSDRPAFEFQMYVLCFALERSRKAGYSFVTYTHMLRDGTGCVTKFKQA
jgi:hypothetical protein|nr:MAG TPA: hypothetical protein [Caudoviricetes sp.]